MNGWYETLNFPPLVPPSWVFGPVWTVLYIMIAISIGIIIKNHRAKISKAMWGILALHFASNSLWTYFFFRLQSPGLALIDIIFLDVTLIYMIFKFWKLSKTPAVLLMPYLTWVLFATYLNIGFYILN